MPCRSFIEISNGALSKSQAEDAIKTMMKAAGFDDKEKISWEDFHYILRDHDKDLQFAQLNVKGWQKNEAQKDVFFKSSFLWTCLMNYCVCCVCRDGKTREEADESRTESVLYLSSKQVRQRGVICHPESVTTAAYY